MTINTCVFILCLGIVVVLGGLAMLCCMNKEEAGAKTMLAGFLLSSLGAVCLLFLTVGAASAIIVGLMCVCYAFLMSQVFRHIKKVKKYQKKERKKNYE